MSKTTQHGDIKRITEKLVNGLGVPQQEAAAFFDLGIADGPSHEHVSALVLNIYRMLIGDDGGAKSVSSEAILEAAGSSATPAQVEEILDRLQARNIIKRTGSEVKLSSGFLAGLIHARLQGESASRHKIASFIEARHAYYIENSQLLNERDLNYITPVVDELALQPAQRQFVEDSRKAVLRDKRRNTTRVAVVILLLTLLASIAVFFGVQASIQASNAISNADRALENAKEAQASERRATASAMEARQAEREALDAQAKLSSARDSVQKLLTSVTGERNIALSEKERARAQERIALAAEARIRSLNDTLSQFADAKAVEAQKAREAERKEAEARGRSEDLRNILLSRIVAQRSIALKGGDKNIKAYTAMLAYQINRTTAQGNVLHPDVYRAVYYAARNQGASEVPIPVDIAGGAIGALSPLGNGYFMTATSDGSITTFRTDPQTGQITWYRSIFYLPHSLVRYVFPQASQDGQYASAFVMGAFGEIIEISLPATGSNDDAVKVGSVRLPEKLFVRDAKRISEDIILVQTSDGAIYSFSGTNRTLQVLVGAQVHAVAYTALPHLGLVCYADARQNLVLTDLKGANAIDYTKAKKGIAQMQIRQYGSQIYLALAYVDGEIEVFVSPQEAFLKGYSGKLKGRGNYDIQSLRSSVHKGYIPAMTFADSAPMLAVGSYDGTATIWNLEAWLKGQGDYMPLILDDHPDWVTACTFAAGDQALITGSKLGTIKFWFMDPTAYTRHLCDGIRTPDTAEWSEYIGDELLDFKNKVCQ